MFFARGWSKEVRLTCDGGSTDCWSYGEAEAILLTTVMTFKTDAWYGVLRRGGDGRNSTEQAGAARVALSWATRAVSAMGLVHFVPRAIGFGIGSCAHAASWIWYHKIIGVRNKKPSSAPRIVMHTDRRASAGTPVQRFSIRWLTTTEYRFLVVDFLF